MYSDKIRFIMPTRDLALSLVLLAMGLVMHPTALAQPGPSPLVSTWTAGTPDGSGTSNWNVASNWSTGAVPDVAEEDAAAINGGGTAQVNSVISAPAGSVVLGQGTEAGEAGTLEILSGGNLQVVSDPSFPADGSVRVGQNAGQGFLNLTTTTNPSAGTGTLRVLPGGTLTSATLTLGGTVDSSITLGGPGAGTATVNTGAVTLGRTIRVVGPNVNFTSSGAGAGITFQPTSIFIPEITGPNHSALKTTGNAALGGTLQADFNGVTLMVGQSWDIIDAASVTGAFVATEPAPGVSLGTAQRITTRTVAGGTNGQLVQMLLQQMPVLTVNRDTGAVSITNPGTTDVPLDGYTIQSDLGGLSMANWQSLQNNPGVAGAGWFHANPSNNRLSELRSGSSSTLAGGGSWGLGNAFQPPAPSEIGQVLDDLVFQYNDPVTQSTVDGTINYTGMGLINNIVLFVDPANGNVTMRNTSPFTVEIDGYTIESESGSLNSNPAQWTSLQDQPGVAGPNWVEANLSDFRVSELMSSGTTTLSANSVTSFELGGLFDTAGSQDLVFQFLLANNSLPNTGVVLYQAAPPVDAVPGDFNGDGMVDAADYTVWRDMGGSLQQFNEWKGNFGATAGSGSALSASAAVPEPTSLLLVAGAVLALLVTRPRTRAGQW